MNPQSTQQIRSTKAKVQGELWSKKAQDWAEIQEPVHTPIWKAMLEATAVGQGTHFLDAGCGGGGASILASALGAKVTGLDAAEGLIAQARKRVPSADFFVGELENLPFDNDSFDVVFAANSIQYSENRIAALQELARVCKPKGQIVAGLFGPAEKVAYRSVFKAVVDTLPEPPKGGGPFELSVPGKLEALFEEAGLKVVKQGETDCPIGFSNLEQYWLGTVSGGPVQAALKVVEEEQLKSAVIDAATPFLLDDGQILIQPNSYIYVVASLPS